MDRKLLQKEIVELTGFSPDKVKRLAELKLIDFDGKHYDERSKAPEAITTIFSLL